MLRHFLRRHTLKDGQSICETAPAPMPPPVRGRPITSGKVPKDHVYVGRSYALGRGPSPFANPFRVGQDGDRCQVLDKYREHLWNNASLLEDMKRLAGRSLSCHCPDFTPWHIGVLIEVFKDHFQGRVQGPTVTACEDTPAEDTTSEEAGDGTARPKKGTGRTARDSGAAARPSRSSAAEGQTIRGWCGPLLTRAVGTRTKHG